LLSTRRTWRSTRTSSVIAFNALDTLYL